MKDDFVQIEKQLYQKEDERIINAFVEDYLRRGYRGEKYQDWDKEFLEKLGLSQSDAIEAILFHMQSEQDRPVIDEDARRRDHLLIRKALFNHVRKQYRKKRLIETEAEAQVIEVTT